MFRNPCILVTAFVALGAGSAIAQPRILDDAMHHLRYGDEPEWSTFPVQTDGSEWTIQFQATPNTGEFTLQLRQWDVKQPWEVLLNDTDLGRLRVNENDMVRYRPVPPGTLVDGENTLTVRQIGEVPDDIRVGEFSLHDRPVGEVLSAATLEITVADADTNTPIPARITVINADGALQQVGAESNDYLAVRPGVVTTGNGHASFTLPAGTYTVYAGRGFEYGLDSTQVTVRSGDQIQHALRIRREVPTDGYVACDTHVHTWTHSRHGEATIEERMITLAAEGIELPIATDHNIHVDYEQTARKMQVRDYFTPVIGNEVTTRFGHFNVFPVETGAPVPDHQAPDWETLFDGIYSTPGVRVAILNHGRDLHGGYLPFGPEHHNAAVGANLDGWNLRANAMEVINSSAQQTDMMRLFLDWFGLLNGGRYLTPVGSSDSHDVGRHFVGQARTYIRADDTDPGNIDIAEAVDNFVEGRVLISLGLLTEIKVNDQYGPGELVPASDDIRVSVRVLGPAWTRADQVTLYANGHRLWTVSIPDGSQPGIKWSGTWTLPRSMQDMHLVAIARGPGVRKWYWPIARPYKPDGPVWTPQVIGATGAVWIDGDGDGKRTSALEYAQHLMDSAGGDLTRLFRDLAAFDEAVAAQVAYLLEMDGYDLNRPELLIFRQQAEPAVQRGFEAYLENR